MPAEAALYRRTGPDHADADDGIAVATRVREVDEQVRGLLGFKRGGVPAGRGPAPGPVPRTPGRRDQGPRERSWRRCSAPPSMAVWRRRSRPGRKESRRAAERLRDRLDALLGQAGAPAEGRTEDRIGAVGERLAAAVEGAAALAEALAVEEAADRQGRASPWRRGGAPRTCWNGAPMLASGWPRRRLWSRSAVPCATSTRRLSALPGSARRSTPRRMPRRDGTGRRIAGRPSARAWKSPAPGPPRHAPSWSVRKAGPPSATRLSRRSIAGRRWRWSPAGWPNATGRRDEARRIEADAVAARESRHAALARRRGRRSSGWRRR